MAFDAFYGLSQDSFSLIYISATINVRFEYAFFDVEIFIIFLKVKLKNLAYYLAESFSWYSLEREKHS